MESETDRTERVDLTEEPVLLVGHTPAEHGILREIACGAPRPVMCRLCHGERDCPYVAARSAFRVRVTYRAPTDPVPPLDERTVATGCDAQLTPSRRSSVVVLSAAVAWLVAVGLVLWFWVVHPPSLGEVVGLVAVKVAVFVFVVAGIPLVRLLWSHHGGRFRRAP